jgi:hypothetical protein
MREKNQGVPKERKMHKLTKVTVNERQESRVPLTYHITFDWIFIFGLIYFSFLQNLVILQRLENKYKHFYEMKTDKLMHFKHSYIYQTMVLPTKSSAANYYWTSNRILFR